MLIIYTRAGCIQCDFTMKYAQRLGIPYETRQLDPESAKKYKEQGFTSLPIVLAGDETWSGFRPQKIKDWKESRDGMDRV